MDAFESKRQSLNEEIAGLKNKVEDIENQIFSLREAIYEIEDEITGKEIELSNLLKEPENE